MIIRECWCCIELGGEEIEVLIEYEFSSGSYAEYIEEHFDIVSVKKEDSDIDIYEDLPELIRDELINYAYEDLMSRDEKV